jgi:RNA polymerase sigma-70 factor (ECF subfamily)
VLHPSSRSGSSLTGWAVADGLVVQTLRLNLPVLREFDLPMRENPMSTCCFEEPVVGSQTVAELVIAAQAGDRGAQAELFRRYQRRILSVVARRLNDEHEAQEVCQEVFLQVLQKIGQLREPACFSAWIRSIAERMAINRRLRSKPVVATEPQALEATCVERQTPCAVSQRREEARQLRDGLQRLRSLDRDTLVAFYFQGQSLLEMSLHFDAPVGTIKRRLHVARQRLARQVEHLVSV